MLRLAIVFAICGFLLASPAWSQGQSSSSPSSNEMAKIAGTVRDPEGKVAPQASITLSSPTEAVAQTQSDAQGQFSLSVAAGTYRIVASLPGLAATSEDLQVQPGGTRQVDLSLELSAVDEHVVVSTALGDLVATETASSVSVVTADEMNDRDAQGISDVLRELPGTAVADSGRRGGDTSVFVRGGNYNYNLVTVDGIPLNQFGGDFDFSPLPTDGVAQVEVVRGAASALYGPDAVTSVVNLVTETGQGAPHFDALAEGGSFGTYRIATDGAGSFHGLSWSYDLAQLSSDGVVANDNYWNQTSFVSLRYSRSPRRQFVAHFFGDANDAGAPGPYGSDPDHLFAGFLASEGFPPSATVDTVSRDKQNIFGYQLGETEQWSSRVKQVSSVSISTDKYYFISPFGNSFENNYKIVANSRSEITLALTDILVMGFEYNREDYEDTFVADANNVPFILWRTSLAPFVENRWNPSRRWTLITGIRVDNILTAPLVPDAIPASTIVQVNPRGATSYLLRQSGSQSTWGATKLHASGGTGIRPPDGFELGFTNNPHLKPERSITTDVGIEQRLFGDRAVADLTYFYNRFEDQIVTTGSLPNLSSFSSANLNNSRAQGIELSVRVQPIRSLEVSGQYTWLDSEILALDGTTMPESPFQVGQPLLRRPRNSGSYDVTWQRGRFRVNSNGYARGWVLDDEPNDGTTACTLLGLPCLFRNHSYFLMNAGFGVRTFRELELFGQLNNILDQKYEEVLGFPAYRFNFMAGIRVHFSTESGASKRP
jgi:outer membrane receptor protein involved in Fe transport